MKSFTELEAWEVAMDFFEEIYRLTEVFPSEEKFALTRQIRRAALSIVGNIAEGFGRFTYADKANKDVIVRGECLEAEAYLHVSIRLKFVSPDAIQRSMFLSGKTGKLLNGLINSCREHSRISNS